MANHNIRIELNPADPVKPLRIVPASSTVLNGEELRVLQGETIEFTSLDFPFSLLFPDTRVINNAGSDPPAQKPVTGGDVFNAGLEKKVLVAVSGSAGRHRSYEYYITAVQANRVFTDDPEVYVC